MNGLSSIGPSSLGASAAYWVLPYSCKKTIFVCVLSNQKWAVKPDFNSKGLSGDGLYS